MREISEPTVRPWSYGALVALEKLMLAEQPKRTPSQKRLQQQIASARRRLAKRGIHVEAA